MTRSELIKDCLLKIELLNQLTLLQCVSPVLNSGTFALSLSESVYRGKGD